MRILMILGGLIGFLIGVLMGSAHDAAWPTILWRASVAAFLAGIILRWWGRVWLNCLAEAQRGRFAGPDSPDTTGTIPAKV